MPYGTGSEGGTPSGGGGAMIDSKLITGIIASGTPAGEILKITPTAGFGIRMHTLTCTVEQPGVTVIVGDRTFVSNTPLFRNSIVGKFSVSQYAASESYPGLVQSITGDIDEEIIISSANATTAIIYWGLVEYKL